MGFLRSRKNTIIDNIIYQTTNKKQNENNHHHIYRFNLYLKDSSSINNHNIYIICKGNCGECKERIENAADIKGVKSATWDENTHVAQITYNTEKVSLNSIETAIAKAGYETENIKADTSAYEKLPQCCKYNHNKHNN